MNKEEALKHFEFSYKEMQEDGKIFLRRSDDEGYREPAHLLALTKKDVEAIYALHPEVQERIESCLYNFNLPDKNNLSSMKFKPKEVSKK